MNGKRLMFNHTLELNCNKAIECHLCKTKNTLKKAHYEEWKYRDKIEGFLCPDCLKKYEEDV